MKRREFIKTSALVVAGAAAAASGIVGPVTLAYAGPKLTKLPPHHAKTLLGVARRIFPHKLLDDSPYWNVVTALDVAAKSDSSIARLLLDGVEQLEKQGSFLDLGEPQQVATLRSIEATPFFQKIRGVALQTIYSDEAVWKRLGYEGPAYAFGGYLHKGFADLSWLPDPPDSASPKPV